MQGAVANRIELWLINERALRSKQQREPVGFGLGNFERAVGASSSRVVHQMNSLSQPLAQTLYEQRQNEINAAWWKRNHDGDCRCVRSGFCGG